MENSNNSKMNKNSVIKSGLSLGLPFVLCAVALILLSIWGYNSIIKNNSFYTLLVSPEVTDDLDAFTKKQDDIKVLPDPEWTDEFLNQTPEEINKIISERNVDSGNGNVKSPYIMPVIKYGQKFGTMGFPRFNFYDRKIYNCDNLSVFRNQVGRALYKWLPGQGKSIVMCGHCTSSFIYLERLNIGDIITIKTIYGAYEYEVVEKHTFAPADKTYVLKNYDEETLTCYTCYPYRTTMPRTQRIAVIAKKISGPDYRYNPSTGNWEYQG